MTSPYRFVIPAAAITCDNLRTSPLIRLRKSSDGMPRASIPASFENFCTSDDFKGFDYGLVELRDDISACTSFDRQPIPTCHFVARQTAFDHGRNVRQVTCALARGCRQDRHLPIY